MTGFFLTYRSNNLILRLFCRKKIAGNTQLGCTHSFFSEQLQLLELLFISGLVRNSLLQYLSQHLTHEGFDQHELHETIHETPKTVWPQCLSMSSKENIVST